MKPKVEKTVNIKNKRASFEYSFIDSYTAGIVLRGTEIKSIRMSKVNLSDAFCGFQEGREGLYVVNMQIDQYTEGTYNNHVAKAERKLLLNKSELKKIAKALLTQGITVIPTRLYINDKGLAKIDISVAKGKKLHDKRADIKTKDVGREMARADY